MVGLGGDVVVGVRVACATRRWWKLLLLISPAIEFLALPVLLAGSL